MDFKVKQVNKAPYIKLDAKIYQYYIDAMCQKDSRWKAYFNNTRRDISNLEHYESSSSHATNYTKLHLKPLSKWRGSLTKSKWKFVRKSVRSVWQKNDTILKFALGPFGFRQNKSEVQIRKQLSQCNPIVNLNKQKYTIKFPTLYAYNPHYSWIQVAKVTGRQIHGLHADIKKIARRCYQSWPGLYDIENEYNIFINDEEKIIWMIDPGCYIPKKAKP